MTKLSGEEKVALLLKSLAPEMVEQVLARLSLERRARLRQLMSKLELRPDMQADLEKLLKDLNSAIADKKAGSFDGGPAILSMPNRSAPAREPPQPVAAPAPPPTPPASIPRAGLAEADLADPLAALARVPAERIALVLADENPRTVSLLLNYFNTQTAGDIFKRLSPEMRSQVTVQFNSQAMPSLDILQRIAHALVRKTQQIADKPRYAEGADRYRKMADMMRLLERADRMQALEALEASDAKTATEVKELLYRFEDVLRVENRSLQKILMDLDAKSLALAMKGSSEEIKAKFMTNLSKRAQDNLQEELEMLRAAPKDQIDEAQKAVVAVIQRLDLAGDLVMTD